MAEFTESHGDSARHQKLLLQSQINNTRNAQTTAPWLGHVLSRRISKSKPDLFCPDILFFLIGLVHGLVLYGQLLLQIIGMHWVIESKYSFFQAIIPEDKSNFCPFAAYKGQVCLLSLFLPELTFVTSGSQKISSSRNDNERAHLRRGKAVAD